MYKQVFQSLFIFVVSSGVTALAETELFACSESGTGNTYFKVCVSDTGNITLLKSPWGMEHIRVYDPVHFAVRNAMEGYGVCWQDLSGCCDLYNDYQGAYDFGNYYNPDNYPCQPGYDCPRDQWSYRWSLVHRIEQPNGAGKFPLRIFRKTSTGDGIVELKQEFAVDTTEREITITMTVYNRSSKALKKVHVFRAVSLAIDNVRSGMALFGKQSVIQYDTGDDWKKHGYPPPYGNRDAVSLTALTSNNPVAFGSYDLIDAYDLGYFCSPYGGKNGFSEGLGLLHYVFDNIPAGASRTVKFAYRAF
jgi:hypothetical protein